MIAAGGNQLGQGAAQTPEHICTLSQGILMYYALVRESVPNFGNQVEDTLYLFASHEDMDDMLATLREGKRPVIAFGFLDSLHYN